MATNVVTQRRPTAWQSILEAICGTEQDFTQGSISRGVFLLATPMVLEMFMESLFAIVDVFWVTRLGSNAIATVGLTESMLTLIFSVAMGVSMSATAMVARRIGEKDPRGAATATVQAILLGVVLAILLGAPGFWFAPRLLEWMGAPADLVQMGHRYTAVMLGGSVSVMLLFLNNGIFRGSGQISYSREFLRVPISARTRIPRIHSICGYMCLWAILWSCPRTMRFSVPLSNSLNCHLMLRAKFLR